MPALFSPPSLLDDAPVELTSAVSCPHSAGTLRTAKLDFLDVKDGDLLRPPHLRMTLPNKLHGAAVELNYSHFSAPRIGCFRRVGKSSVAAGAS